MQNFPQILISFAFLVCLIFNAAISAKYILRHNGQSVHHKKMQCNAEAAERKKKIS